MKIKMRTRAAGPAGNMEPGQVYDVPDAQAKGLVAGGYAENAEPAVKETATGKGQGGKSETKTDGKSEGKSGNGGKETATGKGQGG